MKHPRKPTKTAADALLPGETCPASGQYVYRHRKTRVQATMVRGEPMPPAPKGCRWRMTDKTR